MRILMISDVFFPRINGVSTSIQTFRNDLQAQGHEVFLIAPLYPIRHDPDFVENDTRIFRIPSRGLAFDPEDRMMRFSEVMKLKNELSRLKIDLIHIHTPFVAHYAGIKLAKALAVPCVATYHTLFEEYLSHYLPWVPQQLLRFATRHFSTRQCNQVAGVISPSSLIVTLLQRYGVMKNIITLPTGIVAADFEHGDGEGFRRKLGIHPDKKVLVNVSRIAFEKNIGLLLLMFKELHDRFDNVHMIIAGEGPARKTYMEQAEQLQLSDSISFVGYLNRATELVDCYHAADVFVFASKTETQGLVLLEAMAAGTPVVALAEMGTRDVLKDYQGALITDGSVEDFSSKVMAVLSDDALHKELSLSARHYAQTWDSKRLAAELLDFYQQVRSDWLFTKGHTSRSLGAMEVMSDDGSAPDLNLTPPAKKTGIRRIIAATGYSYDGLRLAAQTESAFKQELFAFIILAPLALWLGDTAIEKVMLVGSLMLVMIVELVNTSIEAVVDRVSSEFHELSRQAKDLGSAAVFVSIALALLTWGLLLL
jgi:1,2-diacylglycerol 3-alpha-glucosyltransferase